MADKKKSRKKCNDTQRSRKQSKTVQSRKKQARKVWVDFLTFMCGWLSSHYQEFRRST